MAESNTLQSLPSTASIVLSKTALEGYERVQYRDARTGTAASEEQQQIEIPKFTTLSDDYALARPRANALQLMDTSDEAYLALHRPIEMLEKKAQESEKTRLELERKRLRVVLDRLTKRVAARGPTHTLLERDRERQQEIQEVQDTLRRYDELLSGTPSDNIGSSLSPAVSDLSDSDHDDKPDRIQLRRRPRKPPRKSPTQAASRPASKLKTEMRNSRKGEKNTAVVELSASTRLTSPASPIPTSSAATRGEALAGAEKKRQSPQRSGSRHSMRLESASSAQSCTAASSPVAAPQAAKRQSFIEDTNLRLQLFPPRHSATAAVKDGHEQKHQRRSPRKSTATEQEIAFGRQLPEAAVQQRDFDLTSSWLVQDAPSSQSDEATTQLRRRLTLPLDTHAETSAMPETPSKLRSSPRHKDQVVPNSSPESHRRGTSQESVVPETEFSSSGQQPQPQPQVDVEADSDEAIEQELVPSTRPQ